MTRKKLDFKSKKAYQKWLAYDHIHKLKHAKKKPKIYIRGHKHKVNHKRTKHKKRRR